VPFKLLQVGKYRTELKRQIKNRPTDNTETKHNAEKANNAKPQQNKTTLVRFNRCSRHSARKWGGHYQRKWKYTVGHKNETRLFLW